MTNPYDKNKAISADEAAKIIPRAEFRVFGKNIIAGVQEHMWKCKATLYAARVMPEEIYFLSRRTNEANVKVRGKFQFPVKREELAEILNHLEVPLELTKDVYSLDEFIEMAKENSELAVVRVEKKRYGFSVEGIICEYAQVWFNGAMVETACCESENYEGMKKATQALGISELPNTNYLKAAKQVLGMN